MKEKKKKGQKVSADFEFTATKHADGGFVSDFRPTSDEARQVLAALTESCAQILEDQQAVNYVEFEVVDGAGEPKYILTIQKAKHPTPHELRRIAEEERDALLSMGVKK